MIDRIISTAVKLWLRSQVSAVKDLQVKITGGDRQMLRGYIPEVWLASSHGVYRGLYLRQIELTGTNICFNLPDVLKRKPLRLLESVMVDVRLLLTEADLQASLASPLLSGGLTDFWQELLTKESLNSTDELAKYRVDWQEIKFAEQKLKLKGILIDSQGDSVQLDIAAGIGLANAHTLLLFPLTILTIPTLTIDCSRQLKINLGEEVALDKLEIESDRLFCSGKITIKN